MPAVNENQELLNLLRAIVQKDETLGALLGTLSRDIAKLREEMTRVLRDVDNLKQRMKGI